MNIGEEYINALKDSYYNKSGKKTWDNFESIIHGAGKEDIDKLKKEYPDAPDSLIKLLEYVDGTYYREYKGEKINFYFLGSDVEEYPYYLLSVDQILETKDDADFYYSDCIDRDFDEGEVEMDDRIICDSDKIKWLHFSDCMNNGGTSQLFIDFSPSEQGVEGQIVRFLHDPDEFMVIADSFDDYLKMLIDKGFDFIHREDM